MSNFTLKWIAILCMFIDHIGAIFTPYEFNMFRIIGRLAFPIFCFLLVEGFYHTRNVKNYVIRLGIFVLLSELPFDLAFSGKITNESQNVFFTLFIGMLVICSMRFIESKVKDNNPILCCFLCLPVIALGCFLAYLLKTDYEIRGILLIVAFYGLRDRFFVLLMVSFAILSGKYEIYAFISMLLISLYNGKKGPSMKFFFYLFYPGHLLILYLLACYMDNKNPLQFLSYLM